MKRKLHIVIIIALSLVWLILSAGSDMALSAWEPPIGIPAPSFGIEETHHMYEGQMYDFGSGPELYKDAGNGPYTHYVDNTHPAATDSGNPFGTASIPRNTIPRNLAEGSVVEVHGGSYGGERITIKGTGTKEKPIFIRGASELERPVFTGNPYPQGSYMIFENLYLNNALFNVQFSFRIDYSQSLNGPVDHIALRNSELEGTGTLSSKHAIEILSSETEKPNNIVIYKNHIHHYGDWQTTSEIDSFGVLAVTTQNLWVVDNHIHHTQGDSVQAKSSSKYVYIGRNLMHENKENAVDIKWGQHVVISENEMYGFWPVSPSGPGEAVVLHYSSLNIWVTHNYIHDSQTGISCSGEEGPDTLYFTNNIIHNIAGAGIQFWSTGEVYVVGNTIYDVGLGIAGSNSDALYASNNIIANLKSSTSVHLYVPSTLADTSNASYNLFYQEGGRVRIDWRDLTNYNVSEFISAFPDKSEGCIEADPQFIDAVGGNFDLLSGSPAIDNGTLSDVYKTFFDLYDIDIRKDIAGGVRPHGAEWDIGAYEYGASSPYNQPPIANAGPDQTVIDEDSDGSEPVTLDGSASFDPDGTIISYVWSEGGLQIATSVNPTVTLSIGEHLITLTVADDGGLTDTDTVTVKVLKGDKEFGELPTGCYNNVFNPTKGEKALIVVELPKQAHIRLNLYNTRGNRIRELADEEKEAGTHKYYWDGKSGNGDVVGSGLYFVHIQAGDYKKTKKIVVVK